MDPGRVRKGEWLAGLSGVALLILLFLPWYGAVGSGDSGAAPAVASLGPDVSAWQAFSFLDLLLLVTALGGIAVALTVALREAPALPVTAAVLATGVAILMALVVLYRLLDQPGPNDFVGVRAGAYLGLLAVLGVAAGGWVTMGDERTETADAALVPAQAPPPVTAAAGSVVARGAVPDAAPPEDS